MYLLIVFEILYMISPFALYYYSLYKYPLRLLQSNPVTSFLTVNLLPHFTYYSSPVLQVLDMVALPLVFIGLVFFAGGFIQVYWAKFTRKKTVTGGLYKTIRHPQYAALAVMGFGTTVFWPRFIVYIMYCTMIFLYYFLARQEERICLEKYGESYREYMEKTGMFLPKFIERTLPRIPSPLPVKGVKRTLSVFGVYILFIAIMIGIGFSIRTYCLSKIITRASENRVVVSIAHLDAQRLDKAIRIALEDKRAIEKLTRLNLKKQLLYIVPSQWGIPELGIVSRDETDNFITNPQSHGNSSGFNPDSLVVLVTEPILSSQYVKGKSILAKSLSFIPCFELVVDLRQNSVVSVSDRKDRGKWDGIPVPIY